MTEETANLHDRIDPELAEALTAVPKPNGRIFDLGNLEGTRELIRQMAAQAEPADAANTAVLIEAHEASRSEDAPVPLRVFRPTNVRGALPAMLWFHDPQAWLADVLARIADHPAQRLGDLLPWNWAAAKAKGADQAA